MPQTVLPLAALTVAAPVLSPADNVLSEFTVFPLVSIMMVNKNGSIVFGSETVIVCFNKVSC